VVHRNVSRVQALLAGLGAKGEIVEFDKSTRTSQEAADAIGIEVSQIAKSLVFESDGTGVMVIASGSNRVSTAKVQELLGKPLSRADADAVRRFTGFPIGGVPPVGHETEMTVLVDEDLMSHDEIWAAGGTPNAVFPLTPDELVRISGGRVADIRE
jgi:prolyl-tRNA editing enzyme YbaK/EbsC (Cys-tRNA(Pro) deacylase)